MTSEDTRAGGTDASRQRADLAELARLRDLSYPIERKDEFVAQMTASQTPVVFRGRSYDAAHVATLIPEFFFPLASEEDLLEKTMDLLASRGLLPLFRHTA